LVFRNKKKVGPVNPLAHLLLLISNNTNCVKTNLQIKQSWGLSRVSLGLIPRISPDDIGVYTYIGEFGVIFSYVIEKQLTVNSQWLTAKKQSQKSNMKCA